MYQYPYGNAQQLNLDWILSKIQALEAGASEVNIEEVANTLIAASFDVGVSYRRYDYCFYNGKLYRALNDTTGAFNPADWLEVVIGDDIPVLTRLLNAVDANLTTLQGQVAALDSDDIDNASTVTGTTVTAALDNLNGAITSVENGIAIVSNGNTHAAVSSGRYIYIKGHNTLSEGLYKATTAIPLNGTLSTSNVTSANESLNTLLDDLTPVYIDAASDSKVPFTFIKVGKIVVLTALYVSPRSAITAGAWTSFGTAPAVVRPSGNRYISGTFVQAQGNLLSTARIYLGVDGEFGGYFSNSLTTADTMFFNEVYVL